MRSENELRDILRSARQDIELISELAREGDAFLAAKTLPARDLPLTADEAAQLRTVGEMLLAASEKKQIGKKSTIHVSANVTSVVARVAGHIKQRTFFSEMALVYLASRMEAFLKDYVQELLLRDPRRLRSNASLSYEEVLSFPSMPALRRALAEKEAEKLSYGSIDEIAQQFDKRFNVQFSSFESWHALREIIYRRNLVVHNRGVVNQTYRSKTGYKGKEIHLDIGMTYVLASTSTVLAFVEFVFSAISGGGAET